MNLDQLRALNAVVDTGSFRAAAKKLHRSQPALSASIKNLEREFGILLFDRAEYRPKLTPEGAAFLSVSRIALESAQYAERVAVELGKDMAETKLRVSVDQLVSPSVIALLLRECSRPALPVNLIVEKSILQGSYQALLNGSVQLAFAACSGATPKMEKILLERVTLVGAVSRGLLGEKRRATAAFLRRAPQVIVYDKGFDEAPDGLLGDAQVDFIGHKVYVPDHATKLRLVEGGLAWGRLSLAELKAREGLVRIDEDLCEAVHLELCLLRAKNLPIGPVARRIWELFRSRAARA